MNNLKTVWVAFNVEESERIIEFVGVFNTREEADATNCEYTIISEIGIDYSKKENSSS